MQISAIYSSVCPSVCIRAAIISCRERVNMKKLIRTRSFYGKSIICLSHTVYCKRILDAPLCYICYITLINICSCECIWIIDKSNSAWSINWWIYWSDICYWWNHRNRWWCRSWCHLVARCQSHIWRVYHWLGLVTQSHYPITSISLIKIKIRVMRSYIIDFRTSEHSCIEIPNFRKNVIISYLLCCKINFC